MEKSIVKTTKGKEVRTKKTGKTRKIISDEDIRRRAFEIYLEKGGSSYNELEDWFRAERELKGNNQ